MSDGAESAAIGARLLFGEGLGLLLEQDGEGALGQAGGSGGGDLLHGPEVDGLTRSRLAQGATGDDFTPSSGQLADFLQSLLGELAL
jgi:hypothetical protein